MNARRRLFPLLLALSIAPAIRAQNLPDVRTAIDHDRVYDVVRRLASPEFGGRLTGDSGFTKAAQFGASIFQSAGLKSVDPEIGYLQPFRMSYTIVKDAELVLTLPGRAPDTLTLRKDYLPLLYTDAGRVRADLVFAGWGISAPAFGYDDYAGLDVRGKIVVCFRGVPNGEDSLFQFFDEHRIRMQTARQKGAVGLFYVYEKPIGNPNGDWAGNFQPAIISYEVADRILGEKGWTARRLLDSLSHSRTVRSFPLQSSVRYLVNAEFHPSVYGYNVLGYIEGTDPALKSECVVVGAHLDHCGTHLGFLFPGASDNASGSAVVTEIARAFAAGPLAKRSVLFVLFGGEEMGLLGSSFLANHIPQIFRKVSAMVNFDMVGTGDGAGCGYSAQPASLKKALDEADRPVHILRSATPLGRVGVRGSDFAPFYQKGTPSITFGSNGPHLFYHEPGDTYYRVNPDMLADMARLGYLTSWILANE